MGRESEAAGRAEAIYLYGLFLLWYRLSTIISTFLLKEERGPEAQFLTNEHYYLEIWVFHLNSWIALLSLMIDHLLTRASCSTRVIVSHTIKQYQENISNKKKARWLGCRGLSALRTSVCLYASCLSLWRAQGCLLSIYDWWLIRTERKKTNLTEV